ncbi:MAG: two-component regulator propeller domain-containing protein [Bacteroidota bacterium]
MYAFFSSSLAGLLITCGMLVSSCLGQSPAVSQGESPSSQSAATVIVGMPPILVGTPGPLNDPTLVSQYIRSIFQDSRGAYWFGPAGQSVAQYRNDTLRYFSRSEFFEGNPPEEDYVSVHAMTEDQQGNLWFGTDVGVVKYDGVRFRRYAESDGLQSLYVSRQSILCDQAGTLWVGTSGGVFRYDPLADQKGEPAFVPFSLLPTTKMGDMLEDSQGNLWFAAGAEGIFRFDGKAVQHFQEKRGLGNGYAGGIAEDPDGNIWFTTMDGISRYDGMDFTQVALNDGIGARDVWGILIEDSGIIWITARGSTTRFDPALVDAGPEAFQAFIPADGLNCCVQSMYQDPAGNVWFGAGAGLYRFDGAGFYQVKQQGPW